MHSVRMRSYTINAHVANTSTDMRSFNCICVRLSVRAIASVCDNAFVGIYARLYQHSSNFFYFTSWCVGHIISARASANLGED